MRITKKQLHIIAHLLRNRFDSLSAHELLTSAPDLIHTAQSIGLSKLAQEMESDLISTLPNQLKQIIISTTI